MPKMAYGLQPRFLAAFLPFLWAIATLHVMPALQRCNILTAVRGRVYNQVVNPFSRSD